MAKLRLGGPTFRDTTDPDQWIADLKRLGYRAAYCPVGNDASEADITRFRSAAEKADIVIAEVGAWSNSISTDDDERNRSIAQCKAALALADAIDARCCVNISGSRGQKWDGPHPDNLSEDTFALTVDVVREIIDAVKPTRAAYTLETMPWVFPDSVESYKRLVKAIDRKGFGVHFDAVNLVNCPQRYYATGDLIRLAFEKLGPWIRSCHVKDIRIEDNLTLHLNEVRPGCGALDHRALIMEVAKLNPDIPLMLEHLPDAAEFDLAAEYMRKVGRECGAEL